MLNPISYLACYLTGLSLLLSNVSLAADEYAGSSPYYLPNGSAYEQVLAPTETFGLSVRSWRLLQRWDEAERLLRSIKDCLTVLDQQLNRLDCITATDIVTLQYREGEVLWSESHLVDSDGLFSNDQSPSVGLQMWRSQWPGTVMETRIEKGPLISVFKRYERLFDDASPWMLYEVFRGAFVLQNRLVSNGQKLTVQGWALSSGMIQLLIMYEDLP
ncbi:hypothetical protein [Aliidiomarina indica]|uniref:hypothetical protein n=1 Tax=Aliidiomarina indica TaxID=2749147 RepID=UPI00188F2928|nr:hypothetical protein [Aliidiomarina indica]